MRRIDDGGGDSGDMSDDYYRYEGSYTCPAYNDMWKSILDKIQSAENLPSFVLEEVSLFLSVTEAQRLMTRICKAWYQVFYESDFLAHRRLLFQEFGLDAPVLPPLWSWEQWIQSLRMLIDDGRSMATATATGGGIASVRASRWTGSYEADGHSTGATAAGEDGSIENRIVLRGFHPRWILIPRHLFYPRRCLHNGVAVLPDDFRFRFASNYSSPSYLADTHRIIDSLRIAMSNDLVSLFSSGGLNNESRRRMMIETVICLRNLASEQIELEVICRRHAQSQSLRTEREQDVFYRTEQTSKARIELLQIRDELQRAVSGDLRGAHLAAALSVADDNILGLLPAADMCGNDKARCDELRGICRSIMTTLEQRVAEDNFLMMQRCCRVLPPLVKKRKTVELSTIQKELEEIKRASVSRLEALLRDNTDRLNCKGDGEAANVRIQVESALFDIAHWKS